MSLLTLSREQQTAVVKIVNWYTNDRSKQIFSVAGFAGVGKSTIVSYAIKALGLHEDNVRYLTYTGKASLVLTRKGNTAQTIHSFCYDPKISSYRDVFGMEKSKITGFDLKHSINDEVKLIVLDEASMISEHLLRDIFSFKTKILALGDPAQLPPVKGKGNDVLVRADVFLDKIHRQAADSPIIWISTLAREGRPLPYGTHGGLVHVIPRHAVNTRMLLESDQVITCQHANRIRYNNQVREYLGFDGLMPQVGEKLICLKNNWKTLSNKSLTPLINGLTCRVDEPIKNIRKGMREFDVTVEIEGSPNDYFYEVPANLDFFEPLPKIKPDTEGRMDHFDFGYAVTCHRAQGSEYDRVLYVHDAFAGFGTPLYRQLLYTGMTRAVKSLTIAL